MIDIHFHCLPAIDDGPRDWDEAVELCRAAAKEGTTTIVATPHVLREPWINDDPQSILGLVAGLNDRLGGEPKVLPGCEYFFTLDAVELWNAGTPLIALNRGQYLLVEFPSRVPRAAENVFHELALAGVTPVIAHPERNHEFMTNPERLEKLVSLGAITQITAASVVGDFGRPAQSACDELFERGLVHSVASDSHSTSRRPPRLADARERVRRIWGGDAERELFEETPSRIIGLTLAHAE